jgi:U3 small nucleolar ribonucleoprotein component
MLKNKKDVLINDNAILEIFSAISRVDLQEIKAEKAMPEEGAENFQQLVDAANAENEQIKAHNEAVNKLKSKISLQVPKEKYAKPEDVEDWHYPEKPNDWNFWNEKCYIRVQNYKAPDSDAPVEPEKPLDKK